MRQEPAVLIGQVTALVAAVLVLLRVFGVPLSEEQQSAIRGLVAVLAPLVAGLLIRQHVYAPATVERLADGMAVRPTAGLAANAWRWNEHRAERS